MIKNLYWYLCKVPVILVTFNGTGYFSEGFRKIINNIKFHENQSIGSRVVSCGRTYMTKLLVSCQ